MTIINNVLVWTNNKSLDEYFTRSLGEWFNIRTKKKNQVWKGHVFINLKIEQSSDKKVIKSSELTESLTGVNFNIVERIDLLSSNLKLIFRTFWSRWKFYPDFLWKITAIRCLKVILPIVCAYYTIIMWTNSSSRICLMFMICNFYREPIRVYASFWPE